MDERAFVAAQDMLLSAKTYWTREIYGALRDAYAANRDRQGDVGGDTVTDVADAVEHTILYQAFAWLERHLQRMKYAGRYGLAPYHDERRRALLASLSGVDDSLLELNAGLDLPAYYTGVDIHQHPGGVWSDDVAGFVYERGARSTTPLLGAAHKDLHDRFTDVVLDGGAPAHLLDMGCGFGKSTQPFVRRLPDSRIDAVDLSAPCLRFAAQTARDMQAGNVRFRQMDACATDYDDGAFSVVTSTMLLHELPPKAIDKLMDEAFRVLEPGGRMIHLDFYSLPDAFRRFIHYGHARRNNEPYMQPLAEMDIAALLEEKGFVDIEIMPFKEAEGVDPNANDAWRFPWTVIGASKPTGT